MTDPTPGRPAQPDQEVDSPQVIIDFALDGDGLFVVLTNLGPTPAYDVAVTFDRPFHGLGGARTMNDLAMFTRLLFLGPGRELRSLIDAGAAYFDRNEPTRLAATVSYRLPGGVRQRSTIRHDLTVYRDLAFPTKGP